MVGMHNWPWKKITKRGAALRQQVCSVASDHNPSPGLGHHSGTLPGLFDGAHLGDLAPRLTYSWLSWSKLVKCKNKKAMCFLRWVRLGWSMFVWLVRSNWAWCHATLQENQFTHLQAHAQHNCGFHLLDWRWPSVYHHVSTTHSERRGVGTEGQVQSDPRWSTWPHTAVGWFRLIMYWIDCVHALVKSVHHNVLLYLYRVMIYVVISYNLN